jgi:hypothetical protein
MVAVVASYGIVCFSKKLVEVVDGFSFFHFFFKFRFVDVFH